MGSPTTVNQVEHAASMSDANLGLVIQQQEKNRTWTQALRKDPRLLFWCGVMLWTLIVRGFESQASGSVVSIPSFKRQFGEQDASSPSGAYFISTRWLSALSGGASGASIAGSWAGSYLADRVGTRTTLVGFACLNVASVGVEFAATSVGMYFGGKMANVVAVGAFLTVCTSYVSDVAPLAARATLIGFCNLAQCIGPLLAAVMANYTAAWDTAWAWKAIIAAQWGFGGAALVGHVFMPESPVNLVTRGKIDTARHSLRRLYTDPRDAEGHLRRIMLTLDEAENGGARNSSSYADCFRGTNLRRTLIAILVFLAEPMSGLGFVSNYGALMYQYLDYSDAQSFRLQIGAQVLSISGAAIALLVSDFWGRRPMFIAGCAGLCLLLICMAVSGIFATRAAVTASVGFYTMFNFFYNVGVGSTVYAIAGEVPTSLLRPKTLAVAISISSAFNTFWSFVSPYMFNPDYGNLKAKIGFVFGAIMFLFIILGFFFVPETRLRSYAELDELFINRVPTRQFRAYVTVTEQRATEAYDEETKTDKGDAA
ncbi:Sugar (and other) transporter [Geosmithia morbida]|uniref:Sugar (And other) transporter n=1 Tax=Geosmithia morbida TaxID=1094350 RepID=A0A9P5D2H8_9HYPO|nr:Sugar (and other) transporter [Geosmithia morbida]KAF4120830.1 Sugar (and other) transporter [Geosmithia morbida]